MQIYELRIYRYTPDEPQMLMGTLQSQQRPCQFTFTNVNELWQQIQELQAVAIEASPVQASDFRVVVGRKAVT